MIPTLQMKSETRRGNTTVGSYIQGLLCPPGHLRFRKEVRGYAFHIEDNWVILKLLFLVAKLCLFCDPMDSSLRGSSVHGISQARIQEWDAISSILA